MTRIIKVKAVNPRSSGDLLEKKAVELFLIRRQIKRLQVRETKLVKSIGRRKAYEGLEKMIPWRANKKLLLKIESVEPQIVDPPFLLKIVERRKGFSVKEDFCDLVTVSMKAVRKRFGKLFADRLSYRRCRYTRITIQEYEETA